MLMKVASRIIVKPAEPTWKGSIPLNELDHVSTITHSSVLYFYDKPSQEDHWLNSSKNKIFDTLRESLSHALVPFYPLAGRLSWVGCGRLVLECNAMGAELIEVESTMKVSDFGDFYSTSDKFEDLLVDGVDYCRKPIKELPLLAVQLTRFACGGLSVGVSISHLVADGRSTFHFIQEWARLARGEPLKDTPLHLLDRRVLGEQSSTLLFGDDDEYNRNYFCNMIKGKPVTPTFVLLTKAETEQLRKVANSNNDGCKYSRFEVIATHVWRCACMARDLKGDDTTTLNFLVDARAQMDPPLPLSYFGNVVVTPSISSYVGELISKPLSYGCSKIRDASKKVTCEYVLDYIEHVKNEKSLIKYQYNDDRGKVQGLSCGDNNLIAISWLNLGAHGVDFGWGNELYFGPPMVYGCDGDVTITPHSANDGSVLVGVFLQPKQKFKKYMTSLPGFKISRI